MHIWSLRIGALVGSEKSSCVVFHSFLMMLLVSETDAVEVELGNLENAQFRRKRAF